MGDEQDKIVPTDYVIESIKAEIEQATPSRRKRIFEAIAVAALGSIPWVGGVIAAASVAADKYKSGEESAEKDNLFREWLQQHQEKLQQLRATLEQMVLRLEGFGQEVDERITSGEYLTLVRKTFREWDEADTDQKRQLLVQLITNAAGTRIVSDDIVRLFLDWIETYHESHFAVIREIYNHRDTIGSKFQQAYATKLPDGQIHVFPIQYNVIHKRWINFWKIIDRPGSERSDPRSWEKLDESTSYQANCAVCHTSQLRNVTGGGFASNNLEFKEPGIDCEMCHGPSLEHVVETTGGQYYLKAPSDPPFNFYQASNRDLVAVCAQCHMQSAIRKPGLAGELNYSSSGAFFGNHLSVPFGEFSRKGFYKDGRFRQTTFIVEALERSQCFKKGQVSCGNCHDPHGHDATSNPTSVKFLDKPDLMCTGCHTQFQESARVAEHTHHSTESEGSRCVSCHMPRIMDALLFRARTHQIDDIPSAQMTQRFGQKESPNACILCHSKKNAEWVRQQLASWKPGVSHRCAAE